MRRKCYKSLKEIKQKHRREMNCFSSNDREIKQTIVKTDEVVISLRTQ